MLSIEEGDAFVFPSCFLADPELEGIQQCTTVASQNHLSVTSPSSGFTPKKRASFRLWEVFSPL